MIGATGIGTVSGLLALALVLGVIAFLARRWPPGPPGTLGTPAREETPDAPAESPSELVRRVARTLRSELGWPTGWQLRQTPLFADTVAELAETVPTDALVPLALDEDELVSSLAAAALAERPDLPADWPDRAVTRLTSSGLADEHFLLQSLVRGPDNVVGAVLAISPQLTPAGVAAFLEQRVAAGEDVDASAFERLPPSMVEPIATLLDEHPSVPDSVRAAFAEWRAAHRGEELAGFLGRLGQVWTAPYDVPAAALVGDRRGVVERVAEALGETPPRSVVIVGEHGVGKTALLRCALARLDGERLVFEATAAAINAGATFVGELEGRVAELVERVRGQDVLWVLPRLDEALWTGQHNRSPQGLLDALVPHMESGALVVAAETSPSGWDVLVKERPRLSSALTVVRVSPMSGEDSIAVAAAALDADDAPARASEAVLAEAYELAQHYLPAVAPPGNLLALVRGAAAAVAEDGRAEIEVRDLLAVLARASGLPARMLDPSTPLVVDDVRAFLSQRVLGQPEAVDALAERIAMVKAGLTDPGRPLGVFLFVGPTGTGKTEIAKALAEFMFGSPARLIRLDMSEFQTADGLERLLSDATTEPRAAPLIAGVRRDPFAVVLMDEFEKAAPPVWDVFLQVFDDGRLTDLQGRAVDFRRCVFVLTSNIGSSISRGGVGFEPGAQRFNPDAVRRTLEGSFRPEFINRIDRVVVFRPFAREQMRALLDKELHDVVERRGLRTRPWAIEYDESALSFLIERGFSPELGARPLKRAVERWLLAPLAQAIVEHTAPSGDQFLFVSARDGRIDVRFVDPDADEQATEPRPRPADVALTDLALRPRADPPAVERLLHELRRIAEAVEGPPVRARKDSALAALGRPGFWDDDDRFEVLATANYLDRLEEALRTADGLASRLERARGEGDGADVAGALAMRLHVLDRALAGLDRGAPDEVWLRVQPTASAPPELVAPFTRHLADMYLAWARARGMHAQELTAERPPDGRHVLLVGGLGAATILADEPGLHILEQPVPGDAGDHRVTRISATVSIAPRPPRAGEQATLAGADAALAAHPAPAAVVRRYCFEPAPLVRDAVRGYRTGRLDRVLAGDFDLF